MSQPAPAERAAAGPKPPPADRRDRPGRRAARRALVAGIAVLAAALLLLGGRVALDWADPSVSSGLVAWTPTVDGAIEVTVDVRRDPGLPVTCEVFAVDRRRAVVGSAVLELPPGPQRHLRATVSVPVEGDAVVARLAGCRGPGQDRLR